MCSITANGHCINFDWNIDLVSLKKISASVLVLSTPFSQQAQHSSVLLGRHCPVPCPYSGGSNHCCAHETVLFKCPAWSQCGTSVWPIISPGPIALKVQGTKLFASPHHSRESLRARNDALWCIQFPASLWCFRHMPTVILSINVQWLLKSQVFAFSKLLKLCIFVSFTCIYTLTHVTGGLSTLPLAHL